MNEHPAGRWRRLGDVAPALFLFLLPIAHTTPLRIACLVLSLLSALAAAPWSRPRPARTGAATLRASRDGPGRLGVAIAFWGAVCATASWVSIEPAYSWGEFRNEVLSPLVAFGVFYAMTDGERTLRLWRTALLASLAVATTIAIAGYLNGGDWERSGFVGDRNAFSTYVVLIVPLLLYEWIDRGGSPARRIGLGIALAVVLIAGAFTQNRNMWFAIVLECIACAALVWTRTEPAMRRRLRKRMLVAAVVGAVVLVSTMTYVVRQKAVVSRTSIEEQARFDRDPRFEIWAYAVERVRERPWFGHGFGRGILRRDFREHFGNPLKWHGHNVVIDYALEAGVVGVAALVALVAAFVARAWRSYRSVDARVGATGVWAITMLVGIGLKVMTDDILVRESSLLFWSVLGMTFGYAASIARREAGGAPRRP